MRSVGVLLTGAERLNETLQDRMALGPPPRRPSRRVLGAWLAKEYVRDVYLTDDPWLAADLLDRVIDGCLADEVRRSSHSPPPQALAQPDPRPSTQRVPLTTDGSDEPSREKDQALRTRLQELRQLPTTRPVATAVEIKWNAHPATTMRARSPQLVA